MDFRFWKNTRSNCMEKTNLIEELVIHSNDELCHFVMDFTLRKIYELQAKYYDSPSYIVLNKSAFEAITVNNRGFVTELFGIKVLYDSKQEELVKFLYEAEKQYLFNL